MEMASKERDEMMYQVSISIAKNMLQMDLITKSEFEKMNCILLEKYNPYIGELFSVNDLIN